MPEFVTIRDTTSKSRYLRPGDQREIRFTPVPGSVTATGLAFPADTQPTSMILMEDDDDTITLPTAGGLRLELFAPGADKVGELVTESRDILGGAEDQELTTEVTDRQAHRQWQLRITNTGEADVLGRASVTFPTARHELLSTAVPIRLLNHAASRLLEALGISIRVTGEQVQLSLSEEVRELLGLAPAEASVTKSLPDEIDLFIDADVRLDDVSFCAYQNDDGSPAVEVAVSFSGDAEVLEFDIHNLSVVFDFELFDLGPIGDRFITYGVSVDTSQIDVTADAAGFESELRDVLRSESEAFLTDPDLRNALREYLTEGFTQLAMRDHVFHDISADPENFLVEHYDPDAGPDFLVPGDVRADLGRVAEQPTSAEPVGAAKRAVPAERERPFGAGAANRGRSAEQESDAVPFAPGDIIIGAGKPRNLEKIETIVFLMLENRSFDHMVGYLSNEGGRADVEGLDGSEANPPEGTGTEVEVHPLQSTQFLLDPHHGFQEVTRQIADGEMSGFVESFIDRHPFADFEQIMGYYTAEQVPTYDFLAENFLLCNRWFSSFPGSTQPNRYCAMSGLTPTLQNIRPGDPRLGYLTMATIFDWLTQHRVPWAYYEHDVSFLRMFDRYRLDDSRVIPMQVKETCPGDARGDGFYTRAENGTLPAVTFIDPNFVQLPPERTANDDHPPVDIGAAQNLVARIYNALVRSPQWENVLFVVTYDEHGGFFDHVAPPGTPASDEGEDTVPRVHPDGPFHLGVRVPAFVVSPWVPREEVADDTFDHTSIIKTILLTFGAPASEVVTGEFPSFPSLGPRVQQAAHLGSLLTRDSPRLDVPTLTPVPPDPEPDVPSQAMLETAAGDFHEIMRSFGLPRLGDG